MNRFIPLPSCVLDEPPENAAAHALPTLFHHDQLRMTPMFPDMSKKRFLNLAAIPACALNTPERGEVFRHPEGTRHWMPCSCRNPIDCSGTA